MPRDNVYASHIPPQPLLTHHIYNNMTFQKAMFHSHIRNFHSFRPITG